MLWQGQRESENVEDARGSGGGRRIAVGGGIGGVILVVAYLLLGGDPAALVESDQPNAQVSQRSSLDQNAPRDDASKFVAVVLADTEDAWNAFAGGPLAQGMKAAKIPPPDDLQITPLLSADSR